MRASTGVGAAVQESERRLGARRRSVTSSPRQMPEPSIGERLAHARPVDREIHRIEPLGLAALRGPRR